MAVEVTLRKIGNSVGLTLPADFVEERHLKPNQKVFLQVLPEADLRDVFGSLKRPKGMSGQKFKDLAKKGWDS